MKPTFVLQVICCVALEVVISILAASVASETLPKLPECPLNCNCINNVIDCSCERPHESMVLSSFKGLEYIKDVHIRSCQRVHIKADTFEGLAFTNDLTISGVAELKLSAFAFRRMRKCPTRLFIKNSHIDQVVPHTFAGFNSAEHLWFRNVSINVVHSYGFADVSDVNNVYFREVTVKQMQSRSFARMTGIANFFLKEKISIGSMGEEIFDGAKMGQVTITDIKIGSMHTHAFSGFHAVESVELTSVTFQNLTGPIGTPHNSGGVRLTEPLRDDPEIRADLTSWERNVATYKAKGPQVNPQLNQLSIKDSTAHLFALDPFANFEEVRLENFTIDRLVASHSLDPDANDNGNLYSVGRRSASQTPTHTKRITLLHMSNCRISKADRFSFDFPIGTAVFERSHVRSLAEFAFHNVHQINSLLFLNSVVDHIHPHSFHNATIGDIIFDGCTVGKISSEAFDKVHLKLLRICSSRLTIMQSRMFRQSEAEKLEFEANSIAELHEAAFTGLVTTKSSVLVKNQFNFTSLNGLAGISTNFLRLEKNQFRCDCSQLLFGDLYYFEDLSRDDKSYSYDIMRVSDNCCTGDSGNSTLPLGDFVSKCHSFHHQRQLSNTADINEALRCHSRSLATECECISPRQSVTLDPDLASELPRFTTVLRIKQCREGLEVEPNSLAKTAVTTVKLKEVLLNLHSHAFAEMPNLLHLELHQTIVQRLRGSSLAFTKRQCRSMKVIDSVFNNGFPTDLFQGTHIGSMEFIKCRIDGLQSRCLGKATIERLIITDSTLTRIEESAFQGIQNLRNVDISNSKLDDLNPKAYQRHFLALATSKTEIPTTRNYCFHENVLNCSCSLSTFLALEQISSRTCPNPKSRRGNVCSYPLQVNNLSLEESKRKFIELRLPLDCSAKSVSSDSTGEQLERSAAAMHSPYDVTISMMTVITLTILLM